MIQRSRCRAIIIIWLHRNPSVEEQRVVIVSADRGSVKLVVVGVLKSDARICPRPNRRIAAYEWNVGDLGDVAVTVWTESTCQSPIQSGVRRAPGVEILGRQNKSIVVPIGE